MLRNLTIPIVLASVLGSFSAGDTLAIGNRYENVISYENENMDTLPEAGEEAVTSYEGYTIDQVQSSLSKVDLTNVADYGFLLTANVTPKKVVTGDIVFNEDVWYGAFKNDDGSIAWYKMTPGETTSFEAVDFAYDKSMTLYRRMPVDATFVLPEELVAIEGSKLSTVRLPEGFTWLNGDITIDMVSKKYAALYQPEDVLAYKTAIVQIYVESKADPLSNTYPDQKYILQYMPGLKLSSINLPQGWNFVTDGELTVGSAKYTAKYVATNGSTLSAEIEVEVIKGKLNMNGVVLTLKEGTTLTDDLLPKFPDGKLVLDEPGKKVVSNFETTCHFTPNDKDNYDVSENIKVIVNVIPNAMYEEAAKQNKDNKGSEEKSGEKSESGNKDSGNSGNSSKTNGDSNTGKSNGSASNNSGNKSSSESDKNSRLAELSKIDISSQSTSIKNNTQSQSGNENKDTKQEIKTESRKDQKNEKKPYNPDDIIITDIDTTLGTKATLSDAEREKREKGYDEKDISVATVTDSTTEASLIATPTNATLTDAKPKGNDDGGNGLLKLAVIGGTTVVTVGGLFLFQYFKRRRLKL